MRWNPFKKPEVKEQHFETVLQRLISAVYGSGSAVTPETCFKSPTVQAIVTAVSRRISSTPVHIYQVGESNGQETKTKLPSHPVANLLRAPNDWQSSVDYWQDLASCLIRYGRYIAVKGRGQTGPIRKLFPVSPGAVSIEQESVTSLSSGIKFRINNEYYPMSKVHYIRGPARDFINGDSIVENIRNAIGLEIACEEYGATFFNNGALPLLIFKYIQGSRGFKTPEDEKKFIEDFQKTFSGGNRHRAMLMPVGIELDTPKIENDKSQFLETRKFYQTVIAGAWGVPQHLVGNLENGHYNNVEQQDKDFTLNVIMPYIRAIESAMERDLLTQQDRINGIIIRFNMDATLRASFQERQAGLQIQFQNGVISPNEWREIEGKNPREDGNEYYYSANLIKEGMDPRANTQTSDE
jgi:HK97 family phage portal protein